MPASAEHSAIFREMRDDGATPLPTLHCLSEAGTAPELGLELARCFGPSAELLWHARGDGMPGRQWWKDSDAFLERAWDVGVPSA